MNKILYSLMLVITANNMMAQDINFSQFYEMPMLRNPALTGIFMGDIRTTTAYRTQWGSVSTPFKTAALGVEFKLPFNEERIYRASLGFQVTNDAAGDSKLTKTQFLPVLNLHVLLDGRTNSFLSGAFMGGMVQHHFDSKSLTFDDQFVNGSYSSTNTTRQQFQNTNLSYFDMSAGLLFNRGGLDVSDIRYYIGLGIFNINQPPNKIKYFSGQIDSARNSNIRLGLNAGITLPSGENDRVTLYADHFRQAGNTLTQAGVLFTHDLEQVDLDEDLKKSITLGIMYRWSDAVIPVIKLEYYQLALGLSYDVNVSKLVTASSLRGGFEVTLCYKSFLNIRNSTLRQSLCPKF